MEEQREKVAFTNESEMKVDVQPESSEQSGEIHVPGTGGGTTGILRRWKREDMLRRVSLGLRGIALILSLISFIIMASNMHGGWKDFDKYQEYRYLLSIAILSSLYTGAQVFRQVHELFTGKTLIQPTTVGLIEFVGDQIVAYLLISSASSAIPITDRMRKTEENIFTDSSASGITFSFLAFGCVAFSAVISGYKLSTQHIYQHP